MTMNTDTLYAAGPAIGHDWSYERMAARDAAREALVDEQKAELESVSWPDSSALMAHAMERLADLPQRQERLNRWLLLAWQHRDRGTSADRSHPTRRATRDYAMDQAYALMTEALYDVIESEFPRGK
jgi:hypothetical protein